MTTIRYYFTIASPWAYLGHAALHEIATRHGAAIDYKPLPLRRLFDASGGLPLARRHPFRQRYRTMELRRWRKRRGVTLNLEPRHSPFDPTLADGVVLAILAHDRHPSQFLALAHAGIWAEDRDLEDENALSYLLDQAGFDAASILAKAKGAAVDAIYERSLDEAIAASVFGAPSYVIDGEVFWGQDRLELLDDMLRSGRRSYVEE